jgi:hypothetical protein
LDLDGASTINRLCDQRTGILNKAEEAACRVDVILRGHRRLGRA